MHRCPEDVHAGGREPLGDVGQSARLVHHVDDDRRAFEVVVAETTQDLPGLVLPLRRHERTGDLARAGAGDVGDVDAAGSERSRKMGELAGTVVELDHELASHDRLLRLGGSRLAPRQLARAASIRGTECCRVPISLRRVTDDTVHASATSPVRATPLVACSVVRESMTVLDHACGPGHNTASRAPAGRTSWVACTQFAQCFGRVWADHGRTVAGRQDARRESRQRCDRGFGQAWAPGGVPRRP